MDDTELGVQAAKRLLWGLVSEWTYLHDVSVAQIRESEQGCTDAVEQFLRGLEHQMAGNEEWCKISPRYLAAAQQLKEMC